MSDTNRIADFAYRSHFWPVYEVENGVHRIKKPNPKKVVPVAEWMKLQGRFRHLFKDGNDKFVDMIQKHIDEKWERLLKLEEAGI
ncbi:hypothetical protein KAW48_04850 [candidate division WOR-3 bacterium]|nr:hypothetical protein [candidate division WOR-3 bacterium]